MPVFWVICFQFQLEQFDFKCAAVPQIVHIWCIYHIVGLYFVFPLHGSPSPVLSSVVSEVFQLAIIFELVTAKILFKCRKQMINLPASNSRDEITTSLISLTLLHVNLFSARLSYPDTHFHVLVHNYTPSRLIKNASWACRNKWNPT
jgi:hypothetical protein